jgi:hypothetical protein
MTADADPHRRESPVEGRKVKTTAAEATGNATQVKTAGRDPRQEIARQNDSRDSIIATRSHKSIRRLTGSPRDDSRAQMYRVCHAWPGQDHE